ncbi:MAG: hypothetical protein SFY32_17740 [Bacteroidota bacterium]|nr:hypothetical protein [Bacteroidota bacterium]
MKNKSLLLASALALTLLASCSKTLILTDGNKVVKIQVANSIECKKDSLNNNILRFESIKGTKYSINADLYTYVIK